jgi:undecaprenyl-diphosphatase
MNILTIIFLSLIEGLTEFLPVSSTAHMYIGSHLLGVPETASLSTFIIAIQTGALFAGAIFILRTIKITKRVFTNAVVAFIPTAIIGFLVYPLVKHLLLGNMLVIGVALIVGGIIILLLDNKKHDGDLALVNTELTNKDAFILGCAQAAAFIPGVSRSGALIIGGKLLKYSRESIVVFTFLLGLPTLAAATVYDLYKSRDILTASLGGEIILGAIISGVIAYVVARWFLKYITTHTFKIFGWYRILAGIIVLIFL